MPQVSNYCFKLSQLFWDLALSKVILPILATAQLCPIEFNDLHCTSLGRWNRCQLIRFSYYSTSHHHLHSHYYHLELLEIGLRLDFRLLKAVPHPLKTRPLATAPGLNLGLFKQDQVLNQTWHFSWFLFLQCYLRL